MSRFQGAPAAMAAVPLACKPLLLCLSHSRWDWDQRPRRLMARATAEYQVLFWEEPVAPPAGETEPSLSLRRTAEGVTVATPWFPDALLPAEAVAMQRELLDGWLGLAGQEVAVAWYCTPLALGFAGHVQAGVTVFDSMEESSASQGTPATPPLLERRLMDRADLVFTGRHSLLVAKRGRHPSWLAQVDARLAGVGWDATWAGMSRMIGSLDPTAGQAPAQGPAQAPETAGHARPAPARIS